MSDQSVFKALSDPTRREILKLLAGGSMSAGEVAEHFEISKPSLSHHFAALKAADLVTTRRQAQTIIYSLNTSVLEDATRMLMDIFALQDGAAQLQSGDSHELKN